MEFEVITVNRSLDLSKNYIPVKAGSVQVGLQTVNDDVAEIEVQSPDGIAKLQVPIGAAVSYNGYTFICRDVGLLMPAEKTRRRLFGKKEDLPKDGLMEAVIDVRWGDQALEVLSPEKNFTYNFMLARQYEILKDRPLVYEGQDVIQFGDMRLRMGNRVEEGSRNWRNPRFAEFLVQFEGEREEEVWQIKLNGKYDREKRYRVRVTHYDWYNGWYQAYGISLVHGRPKEEMDETDDYTAQGIAHVATVSDGSTAQTRLQEARNNPSEGVFKAGESKNIGSVGIKVLDVQLGKAKVMFLSPKIATTTLIQGQEFDFGKFDVLLIGVYDDKAIIRITPDDD